MDKITNVKEVSSFIMNFDDKLWNEVVLQLTIIGIRYINKYCHNYFKWRMDDLLLISEQLRQIKSPSIMNYKSFTDNNIKKYNNNIFNKNQNSLYKYNFNYSNLSIYKESKDKSKKISNHKHNKNYFKSKSLLNKSSLNDAPMNKDIYFMNNINGDLNMNNNSMQVLSGRENQFENLFILDKTHEKESNKKRNEKILNYFENNNEENTLLKNKKFNNRSKILSLNKKLINKNIDGNNNISSYPLYKKNIIDKNARNDENKKDSEMNIIKNNNNDLDIYINNNNDFKNNNNCNLRKTYYLEYMNISGNKIKNNNYLIEEIKKQNEKYNKDSNDFITELRKLSHSKEKISKNNNNRLSTSAMKQNQSFHSNSPFSLIDNNLYYSEKYNQNNYNDKQENNILKNLNDENDNYKEVKNYNNNMKDDNCKDNNNKQKENPLLQTDNKNHEILIKKDNINLTYAYNSNINNSMEENIQNNKIKYNKYLKNPNYKTKKNRSNSIDDLSNKVVNNKSYYYSPGKENENNMNKNSKNNNINYEKPNTERTTCHYFYESKQQSNKENTINKNKKDSIINKY